MHRKGDEFLDLIVEVERESFQMQYERQGRGKDRELLGSLEGDTCESRGQSGEGEEETMRDYD
jgi:hypothetical protein